jgi:ribonuclease HII
VPDTVVPRLRPSLKGAAPDLRHERELWASGARTVAGVDEVGRGAWAGPITVGVAVITAGRRVYKIRDSKLLTEAEREALFERIAEWCLDWAVGHASPEECDRLGMSAAHRLAAGRALDRLAAAPDAVLVDGRWDFVSRPMTRTVVGGDARCLSVAAASVLAKVTRDRIMRDEAGHFPQYGFEGNKGYPDPRHRAALQAYGPSSIHRRSWVYMDRLIWSGIDRVARDGQERLF